MGDDSGTLNCFFHKAGRIFIAIALCVALGGHWFLLQTVAWTGMLITYSRDASVVQAIGKTFDGEHPCPLCKKIQGAQKDEQKKSSAKELAKKDLKYPKSEGITLEKPPLLPHSWPLAAYKAQAIPTEPPVPPPRAAA